MHNYGAHKDSSSAYFGCVREKTRRALPNPLLISLVLGSLPLLQHLLVPFLRFVVFYGSPCRLAPLIPIFTCSQHRVRNAHPNIANFHTPYLAMGSMLTPRENVAMLCDINALELELRTCYRGNRFSHRFLWHRNRNIVSSPRRMYDTEMYDTETCDTGMYDSVSCKWRQ